MNPSSTRPLLTTHQHAVKFCLQNLEELRKSLDELDSVKNVLETLPHKTRRDVMVPFGISNPSSPPLMLMEGCIEHTNEIMVLLGDNWFLERSAKESIDIINRRQDKIRASIEKLTEEKEKHEKLLNMITSLYGGGEDFHEITEKYDEEEERRWKENHRQKVREHKQREAAERTKLKESHEDMMKRLENLELMESEPVKSSLKSGNSKSKSVMFKESIGEKYEEKEEIGIRPEKEERREMNREIFSGEVVERRRDGWEGKERREPELRGNEGEDAPLRDPTHKDQEPPPPPKKVSQFKLARQTR